MLQNKILCPDAGDDYATDSGEALTPLYRRAWVSAAFPGGLFVGQAVMSPQE